jgi:uncharacterized protein YbjT (DUF2867 family)
MTTLLLAGATGLVGQAVLRQALADPRVARVVAPTRTPLPAQARLHNPVVDFDHLPADADWWKADAVVCTLGTTIRVAGSQAAFRKVDHDYPLAIARLALQHGATTYVLTSASGANPGSRIFYSRTKGELERELATLGYEALTFVRPGLLGGERTQRRTAEYVGMQLLKVIGPLLPRRYRMVPAESVAAVLLRCALESTPGVHVIESEALHAE